MKKALSLLTAVLMIISAIPLFAFAENEPESSKIVIELRSDIAGKTVNDYRDYAIIKSDNVIFDESQGSDAVLLCDYVGNIYTGKMKAGRTYTIWYTLYAADGFEIPDELDESNTEIICGKGVDCFGCFKCIGNDGEGNPLDSISLLTEVKVDGNPFQNFIGTIMDFFLKMMSWSMY